MVRLGAQSVDFATHFLRDEAKLFTLALRRAVTLALSHCVEEISEMSPQTGLFLGHVKFLYVENHLLFETTFVNLDGIEARKLLLDACLYFGHPFCLIRLYSIQKSAEILYLSDKEVIEFATFRGAELLKSVDCGTSLLNVSGIRIRTPNQSCGAPIPSLMPSSSICRL